MNNDINLISNKKGAIENQEKLVRIFKSCAYGSLLAVAIVSVILFLFNYFSPLPKLQAHKASVEKNLLSQKSKITQLLLVRDRLKNIDSLTKQDSPLEKALTSIAMHTPGDASVESFGISKDGVSLIITSPSLNSVNTFLAFLTSEVAKKSLFKKVTIGSLAVDVKNGKYTLALSATLL